MIFAMNIIALMQIIFSKTCLRQSEDTLQFAAGVSTSEMGSVVMLALAICGSSSHKQEFTGTNHIVHS